MQKYEKEEKWTHEGPRKNGTHEGPKVLKRKREMST
jgi:hypothetical protein